MSYQAVHTGGQSVRTRSEAIDWSSVVALETGAFDAALHMVNIDGLIGSDGFVRTAGFTRLILYVKADEAGELRLDGKRGAIDVDIEVLTTIAVPAGTKVGVFDLDVSTLYSFRLLARSTAAAGQIAIMLRLI